MSFIAKRSSANEAKDLFSSIFAEVGFQRMLDPLVKLNYSSSLLPAAY